MSYSVSTRVRIGIYFGCLAVVTSWLPASVRGQQESLEDLYNKAKGYYDNGKWEDACDSFQKIASVSPDYAETRTLRDESCHLRDGAYQQEDLGFKQARDLFDHKDYENAKAKFQAVLRIQLKNPKHRKETLDYLDGIKAWEQEEGAFKACLNMPGNTAEARDCFAKIARGKGRRAEEALAKQNAIEAEMARASALKSGKPGEQSTVGKPKPPTPVVPTPYEDRLRAGLQAYFAGKLDAAERQLNDYLKLNGPKKSLGIFFLGAVHGSRYLLSGESDASQKDRALDEFRRVRKLDPGFQPPERYVSPRIQLLYGQAGDLQSPS